MRVASERFGGLDILVNNAAISRHVAITETSIELYEEVIGVNLTGSFLACKFAIPALIDRGGGSIVNIGSIAAIRDSGTHAPRVLRFEGCPTRLDDRPRRRVRA